MLKRPHIVIFNPDQWRGDVMGHIGNPAALTPNLDRFAEKDGVSFRNAFCQSTVCTPSRCSFMTGWYPHVRGHRTMHHMLHFERGETNLLQLLKDNGYLVWWGGKNDLVPAQDGYDDHCDVKFQPSEKQLKRWGYTLREGNHDGDMAWRGPVGGDNYYSFFKGKLDKGESDFYCDSDVAMVFGAIDFIREYEGEMPLCIYMPLANPHPPYCIEEPWYSAIVRAKIPPRTPTPANWARKPSINRDIQRSLGLDGWTEERWTELRAVYYGMCARLDHQFGLLTNALKETGLYDDSAVFVFSDHGDFTGDYGLVEKTQNTFEDCLSRVPFLVKPPAGLPVTPRVSDAMVELVDFTATVYQLTGVDPGYTHFGRSLLPVLSGTIDEHRDAVFCEGGRLRGETHAMEQESMSLAGPEGLYYPRLRLQTSNHGMHHTKAAMCRTKTHKYVRRHEEQDELYDLDKDPLETTNMVDNPAYGNVLGELRERLLAWYMDTCDVVPQSADQRG